jgi:hypothetical protein
MGKSHHGKAGKAKRNAQASAGKRARSRKQIEHDRQHHGLTGHVPMAAKPGSSTKLKHTVHVF